MGPRDLDLCSVFTSPRLRGEVARRRRAGEGGLPQFSLFQKPLTPTFSPQAGRGSPASAGSGR